MSTKDQEKAGSGPTSEEQNLDPDGSNDESQNSNSNQDGQGSAQVEDLSVQAAPGARDFSHPLLKGKSPEEIERLFSLQEQAVRDQNAELNRRFEQQQSAPAPRRQEETQPAEDGYGDDFLAPRFRVLETRLKSHLNEVVEPLRRGQQGGESRSARDGLRTKHKHFARLEPYIDQLLREKGVDPNTAEESTLSNIYHTAVGLAVDRGINLDEAVAAAPQPKGQERGAPPVNIPQHRASAAPLPQERPQANVRQLTESEKRLAREYFPDSKNPEKDYREYQDMQDDDVVQPGYSKENW